MLQGKAMRRVRHQGRRIRRRKNCKLIVIVVTSITTVWMIYQTVFNSTMMDRANRRNIDDLPKCNFCVRNFATRLKADLDEDYAMADLRKCRPITCVPTEEFYVPSTVRVNDFDLDPLLSPNLNNDTDLVAIIIVHTRIESFDTRARWRESMGEFLGVRKDFDLLFITGSSKDRAIWNATVVENRIHDDLIIYDFPEEAGERNTSPIKTAMMLRWFSQFGRKTRFLVKINDDTYVKPQKLAGTVEDLPSSMMFAGKMSYHQEVKRNPRDESAVSDKVYPYPYWPNYISGQLYIISADAVSVLWSAAPYVLPVPLEDAWLTILAHGVGVVRNFIPDGFR